VSLGLWAKLDRGGPGCYPATLPQTLQGDHEKTTRIRTKPSRSRARCGGHIRTELPGVHDRAGIKKRVESQQRGAPLTPLRNPPLPYSERGFCPRSSIPLYPRLGDIGIPDDSKGLLQNSHSCSSISLVAITYPIRRDESELETHSSYGRGKKGSP